MCQECSQKSLNPVNWNIAIAPREKGGLGITLIANTNFALLAKWLWRCHYEPKAL